jgi:dihydrofolate synthase/folylpolyglutamate synthase
MSFSEAVRYLLSLGHETLTMKLGLRSTELLLEALDNPHRSFLSVQIAGTNGKGSTAAMVESICRAAGIKTGLYTSPHLTSITERIKIDGADISEDDFARYAEVVRSVSQAMVEEKKLAALPTFFEQVTAIALHAFREARVELAILETGLGGRLDSTTAAGASFVGITAIAMDHEEYLGDTIEMIAAEKAATIQANTNVVIGRQVDQVLEVLLARCRDVGVTPILDNFQRARSNYRDVQLGLAGSHQEDNAAIALLLAEQLRSNFEISDSAIVKGLASVRHAGRLELIPYQPAILLDGAHNPAGAAALSSYLSSAEVSAATMIFGAMREKRLDQIAETLFTWPDKLILTKVENPRSASPEDLESLSTRFARGTVYTTNSALAALELALEVTPPEGLICITGSLYLIGELRPHILKLVHRRDAEKQTNKGIVNG